MSQIIAAIKDAFLYNFDRHWGLLVLRVHVGLLMFFGHGYGKFVHFADKADSFRDPFGLGPVLSFTLVTFAEAGCSLLVVVGLLTRFALVPLMVAMSVAVFIAHADDPFAKKELALLYLGCFIALFLTGPGRFSLDRLWFKDRIDS